MKRVLIEWAVLALVGASAIWVAEVRLMHLNFALFLAWLFVSSVVCLMAVLSRTNSNRTNQKEEST